MNYVKSLQQKKEFIALDFFRLICAALVMAIHLKPFSDINIELSFWISEIFARIAVPFFFMMSGFFAYHTVAYKKTLAPYINRLVRLYLIYTILYFPQNAYSWLKSEDPLWKSLLCFIRNTFVTGSYAQLWYFVGLIVALLLLHTCLASINLSDKQIMVFATILYGIGVLGDSYKNLFLKTPVFAFAFHIYDTLFVTTRNGVFFGFLFIVLGYMIQKYHQKIKNHKRLYSLVTMIAFVVMNFEEYHAQRITNHTESNMLFSTPMVVIFLFLAISFIEIPHICLRFGIYCRKLSVLIFGLQFLFNAYIGKLILHPLGFNSLERYLIILLLNIIIGIIILRMQRFKRFSYLKYLY